MPSVRLKARSSGSRRSDGVYFTFIVILNEKRNIVKFLRGDC